MPGKAVPVLWIVVLFCSLTAKGIPVVRLQPGMVIRESVIISRESYLLNAPAGLSDALITIEGKNIVVDFDQAILQGSNDKSRPDEMYGLALRIKKGSGNITIRNAGIHGYKVAILADSVDNLVIDHCDLSYNWRQHL
ncbi:MAG: hypothetical protein JWQ78_2214, partial [Sediminibacterium sp.]|nr:hypothetical protein [Sediminibacterium sp.]